MRVTRHLYEAPGFGVGEVWTEDGVIVRHELATEALRRQPEWEVATAAAAPAAPSSLADNDRSAVGRTDVGETPGPGRRSASKASPNGGARLPARTLPRESIPNGADCVPDLCRRVVAHLSGVATSYEGISIDLSWATPLQRDLVTVARAIPWGEVVSYGELAALAGRPRAARAAGSFCAENRFSLIVPCHRVVAARGIGGYGAAGLALKRRLLALEDVHL